MSQRQVRRLLQPQSLTHDPVDDDIDDEVTNAKAGKVNRYRTFLIPDEDTGQVDQADDVTGDDEEDESQLKKEASKGKKRKKKRKQQTSEKTETRDSDEDVVQLLSHLMSESSVSPATTSQHSKQSHSKSGVFMRIERRHLNYESEKLVIMTKNAQLAHRLSQKMGKNRGHDRRTGSGHLLVHPNHYARLLGSALRMDLQEKEGDVTWFRLVHKPEYQKMQEQLLQALESPDPGQLISLLSMNPAHPELLLQVSHLVHREDRNMAAELLERAISCYESVFHPRFLLSVGSSRMKYRLNENRPLFVSMFRHICCLGRKGYHRTALEVCKLLWSLDPDGDPLAVLLMIDFYALSSNQMDFLTSMYQALRQKERLDLLPNFRFSMALALFKKATSQKQVNHSLMQEADILIQDALLLFPQMLLVLLDKCSVEPDRSVVHSDFFNCAAPKSLHLLLVLYAERAAVLWYTERETIYWLERNVQSLIQDLEQKKELILSNKQMVTKSYSSPVPRNVLRHVFLSDFKESSSHLPVDSSDRRLYAFDPFPPIDATASYDIDLKKRDQSDSSSILGLFLQSWMPGFNPETPASTSADDNRLKSSISSLMQAMSHLLTTANQEEDDV